MTGPSGTAFLYVKEDMLDQLQAYHIGGLGDSGWDMTSSPPLLKGYAASAHRYDYGTQSATLMKGVSAAIDFQLEIGKEKIESRLRELNQYLFDGLLEFGGKIEILSPSEAKSRISMVSFRPINISYQQTGNELGKMGFRIRQVPEGGVNAIRVSTHIYNSKQELDSFLLAFSKILG
jgi:selenocysteine lyase/cysteine desulfurase